MYIILTLALFIQIILAIPPIFIYMKYFVTFFHRYLIFFNAVVNDIILKLFSEICSVLFEYTHNLFVFYFCECFNFF